MYFTIFLFKLHRMLLTFHICFSCACHNYLIYSLHVRIINEFFWVAMRLIGRGKSTETGTRDCLTALNLCTTSRKKAVVKLLAGSFRIFLTPATSVALKHLYRLTILLALSAIHVYLSIFERFLLNYFRSFFFAVVCELKSQMYKYLKTCARNFLCSKLTAIA